jgi:hypothetical protein
MRVLVQLRSTPAVLAPMSLGEPATDVTHELEAAVPTLSLDHDYAPVQVPRPVPVDPSGDPLSMLQPLTFSFDPEQSTYLVRGELADAAPSRLALLAASHPDIVGVFADPKVETTGVYCGDAPVGTADDVAHQLGTATLASRGLDGAGVALAIVDTGINAAFLRSKGLNPTIDASRSWSPPGVSTHAGEFPVAHGSMCAYDALIAAPKASLLDVAIMAAAVGTFAALLSDAVQAYAHLRSVLDAMPADGKHLVVSNSWGIFDPAWDFPVGSPGNYSDNPAHPFNIIVGSLAQAGADILFAAGNCGRDCPDSRCRFGSARPINGANSHPQVLSVAGITVQRDRVGYSSQGPGRLADHKPDVSSYTHFLGSEAEGPGTPDSGTSAACPVLAGAVAALRTGHPSSAVTPEQFRALVAKTSVNLGAPGYDYDYGWGAVDPVALADALAAAPTPTPVKKSGGTKKAAKKTTKKTTKTAKKTTKKSTKSPVKTAAGHAAKKASKVLKAAAEKVSDTAAGTTGS